MSTIDDDDLSDSDGEAAAVRRDQLILSESDNDDDSPKTAAPADSTAGMPSIISPAPKPKPAALADMFKFKEKKTFQTHSAAAQLKMVEEAKDDPDDAADRAILEQSLGLNAQRLSSGDDDDADEPEEDEEDASDVSEESGGSQAVETEAVATTPRSRVALLFAKYNVDPIPARMADWQPGEDHSREMANLKCAVCIYSRPQVFCKECGYLMCKQCSSFVHRPPGASSVLGRPPGISVAADDGEMAAAQVEHRPEAISVYAKRIAQERYEKALQAEREAQAQRELEEQLAREEALRRNQKFAFELMKENGGMVGGRANTAGSGSSGATGSPEHLWGGSAAGGTPSAARAADVESSLGSKHRVRHTRRNHNGAGQEDVTPSSGSPDGLQLPRRHRQRRRSQAASSAGGSDVYTISDDEYDDGTDIDFGDADDDDGVRWASINKAGLDGEPGIQIEAPEGPKAGAKGGGRRPGKPAETPAVKVTTTAVRRKPKDGLTPAQAALTPPLADPLANLASRAQTPAGAPATPPLLSTDEPELRPESPLSPSWRDVGAYVPTKQLSINYAGGIAAQIAALAKRGAQQLARVQKLFTAPAPPSNAALGAAPGAKASRNAPTAVPQALYDAAGSTAVDALLEPVIPASISNAVRRWVGKAMTGGMRLAVVWAVTTFDDPWVGPHDSATLWSQRWRDALEASGYVTVVLTPAASTASYLRPTLRNISLVLRALSQTIDQNDFRLVIGVLSKGVIAALPLPTGAAAGASAKRCVAMAQDTPGVLLSAANALLPETLSIPDCCGNAPIVFVDCAPLLVTPVNADVVPTGFMWMTGNVGPSSIVLTRYPVGQEGWLGYYLPRAESGHGAPSYDGRVTITVEDLCGYLARKMVSRGAVGVEVTGPMLGWSEATADLSNYSGGMPLPVEGLAHNGSSRTVEEQRRVEVLRALAPVTHEALRASKKAESDILRRVWITGWVSAAVQAGDASALPSVLRCAAQWMRDVSRMLPSAVATGNLANTRPIVGAGQAAANRLPPKQSGAGGKQHAEVPLTAAVVGLVIDQRATFVARLHYTDTTPFARDKSKADRLLEKLSELVRVAMRSMSGDDNQNSAVDVNAVVRLVPRWSDGYIEATFVHPPRRDGDAAVVALSACFLDLLSGVSPQSSPTAAGRSGSPVNTAISPSKGKGSPTMRGAAGSPVSRSAAGASTSWYHPAAISTCRTIAVNCNERDVRRLFKLAAKGVLRRVFTSITDVQVDRVRSVSEHSAAATVQRVVRGMIARRAWRPLVRTLIAETTHRRETVDARHGQLVALHTAHQIGTQRAAIAEEDSVRKHVRAEERVGFYHICGVRLSEMGVREGLFRQVVGHHEAQHRMAVAEAIHRVRLLHNAAQAWQTLIRKHQHDFRCLWDKYYIMTSWYTELLDMCNTFTVTSTLRLGAAILPLDLPPCDFEYASSFVAFSRDIRDAVKNFTRLH